MYSSCAWTLATAVTATVDVAVVVVPLETVGLLPRKGQNGWPLAVAVAAVVRVKEESLTKTNPETMGRRKKEEDDAAAAASSAKEQQPNQVVNDVEATVENFILKRRLVTRKSVYVCIDVCICVYVSLSVCRMTMKKIGRAHV